MAPRTPTGDRHRHRRPGRAVRRHDRRHLAARACSSWAWPSSTGSAIGAAIVVAVTLVASITLLPALLGFAGDRIEVTRWRGPHRRRPGRRRARRRRPRGRPLLIGLPRSRCRRRCIAGLLRRAAAAGGAAAGAEAAPRDAPGYRWSRFIQRTRGRRRSAAWPSSLLLALPVLRPAPRLLRRGQLPRGHHHPPGLRPARRGLRARLQRPARPGDRGARRAPTRPTLGRGHRGRRRDTRSRRVRLPGPVERRRRPDGGRSGR